MAVLLKNNAVSKLAGSIDATQVTLSVQTGEGARFPSPTGGDYFPVTLEAISGGTVTREIVHCTSRSGDILTVTRAQEGTTGQAFTSGDRVELRYTAAVHDALKALIAANGALIQGNTDLINDPSTGLAQRLLKSENLNDLPNKATARTNLDVVDSATISVPTILRKTADTGAAVLPSGTTAQRPAGVAGHFRHNAELDTFEGFNGTEWGGIGGATGAGGNPIFYENDQTVTGDYTIPADKNAMSSGPITIATGVTVTVSDGAVWHIL